MDYCNQAQNFWYTSPVDHIEPAMSSGFNYMPVDNQQFQTPSPVSDHSSYDQVPSLAASSITSNSDTFCDELNLEDSLHARTSPPIQDLTDYYLFDSGAFTPSQQSPPGAQSLPSVSYQSAPHLPFCPHGCKRSFGRTYELNRHLREQHQCRHHDCKNIFFPKVEQKRNHEEQEHGRELGYLCGTCELTGESPKPIPRDSKLKKHFEKSHSVNGEFGTFRCTQESCYPSNCDGGLFFTSQDELNKHDELLHGPLSMQSCPDPATNTLNRSTVHPLSELPNSVTVGKRYADHDPQPEPKRWKNDTSSLEFLPPVCVDTANSNDDQTTLAIQNEGLADVSKETTAEDNLVELVSSKSLPQLPETREETITVSITELHALIKHHEWKLVLKKLSRCNLEAKFVRKPQPAAIKLRGQCSESEMIKGRLLLTQLINDSKPPTRHSEDFDKSTQVEPKPSLHQQCRCPNPILAMDPIQDSKLLAAWNGHFLRDFKRIVKAAKIEGSSSASLVRFSAENGTYPIIRFQSSENQGPESRKAFEESVAEFCSAHELPDLVVQFTEGTLVRLMAGGSTPSVMNDPPSNWRFPHSRRYWPAPGLGASIGPTGCPHVSATLGGYITVDGRLYMLSVDHFITICRICPPTSKLRSPSIIDLRSVKRQLRKKLNDIQLRIERSMQTDEIDLEHVQDELFSDDVELELEQYQRIQAETEEKEEAYGFATVKQRVQPSRSPRLGQGYALHRMDWSLSEVTEPYRGRRQGKNMHRHGREANPSIHHLEEEILHPYGTGPVCTEYGDVQGGERVFYVGTTSGLRQGVVNPALFLYVDEHGQECQEYSITVQDSGLLRDSDFEGDSGAWVIRQDGVLIGLLWGWANGNLLFTPIKDVFEDIKDVTHRRNIKLPEDIENQAAGLCARVSCSTSRDNSPERQMAPPEVTEPSPFTLLLNHIGDLKPRRRVSSGASSTFSLPSLLSSSSSVFEDIGPETPVQAFELKLPIRMKTDPLPTRENDWVVIKQEDALVDNESAIFPTAERISF